MRKAEGKRSKVKDAQNFYCQDMGKIACEDSKPLGATVSPAAVIWASGIAHPLVESWRKLPNALVYQRVGGVV